MKLKYSAADVRYTSNGNNIYAMILGVPEEGTVMTLKGLAKNRKGKALGIKHVSLLGSNQRITWSQTAGGLQVTIPSISGENAIASLKHITFYLKRIHYHRCHTLQTATSIETVLG